jgi:hypothetical protein
MIDADRVATLSRQVDQPAALEGCFQAMGNDNSNLP